MRRTKLFFLILPFIFLISLFIAPPPSTEPATDGITEFWFEGSGIRSDSYNRRKATDMINWLPVGDRYYLMVPQSADLSKLRVFFVSGGPVIAGETELISGQPTDVFAKNSNVTLTCGTRSYSVITVQSSAIPTVFIATASGNLESVHASKDNREAAKILIVEDDGVTVAYNGAANRLNGRGNATWWYEKKPYNFRLDTSAALLGMGDARHWALIANYVDHSHLRHLLAYELSAEVGIEFSARTHPVDMYMNNEYMGLYFLTERIRVGNPLVDITDLEAATVLANGGLSLDVFPQSGLNEFSTGTYKYFDIPNDPADITGGYLLEWELRDRYQNEASGFVTNRGQAVVISHPRYVSKRQAEYIRAFAQDMEDAVYSRTGYNDKGIHFTHYIDEYSFAKMYVLQEFTMNLDAAITSFYVYKDSDLSGDGKLRAAPPWDFDLAFGNHGYRDGVDLRNPGLWWVNSGRIFQNTGWMPHILNALYRHDSFKNESARIWRTYFAGPADKMVNPNSTAETRVVRYIGDYAADIDASAVMNRYLWRNASFSSSVNSLIEFTAKRAGFLTREWGTILKD
jgi:hypothetical protein